MPRLLIVLLGFVLTATACGGGNDPGTRVKLVDLSIYGGNHRGTDRHFHGTCPRGRLTVDFQSGDQINIRNRDRLVASLSPKEAFIGCSDARIEDIHGRNLGWLFRRFAEAKGSTKLVCMADERIDIWVSAAYKFQDTFDGGGMIVATPPSAKWPQGHALLASSLRESDDSTLSYHTPRCQVIKHG